MTKLTAMLLSALILLTGVPPAAAKTYILTNGDRSITYTAAAGEAAWLPPVRRGLEVTLRYRGEELHSLSDESTVGELLASLGLEITGRDTLSHTPDTLITGGMEITVDSWLAREETYTATVPHEITYCSDPSLPEGVEEVLIPGRDGELLYSARVTYRNGREVSREVISEKQTIAPVTELMARGTAAPEAEEPTGMPVIQDGYITMPSGEILTYYKTDNVTATGYTHTDPGCDLITSTGTTVRYGTAAVDPRFIPYGTRMLIVSHDGQRYYGIATAEDCGGAIKRDKMDLYFPTREECLEFGRRRCTIYFLG